MESWNHTNELIYNRDREKHRKQTYAYQRGELAGGEWIDRELSIYRLIYLSIDLFISLSIWD